MKAFLMSFFIAVAITLLILLFWPAPASAQSGFCDTHKNIVGLLEGKYKEHVVIEGMTKTGLVLIVYASEGGTWSVIMANPVGLTCMIAVGVGFKPTPLPIEGDPA
jgi:hypothetical protein